MKHILAVDVHNIKNNEKVALIITSADSIHIMNTSNAKEHLLKLGNEYNLTINYPIARKQLYAIGKVFELYEYEGTIL